MGHNTHRWLLVVVIVAAALLLALTLASCQDEEPIPTPVPPTATAVPATPTPVPSTPQPTATPTRLPAQAILQAAFDAAQATTYRFDIDMDMTMSGADIGDDVTIAMRFQGDFAPPDNMQGTMTLTVNDVDVETQLVVIGGESYVLNPLTTRWQRDTQSSAMFNPEDLMTDPSDIQDLALVGETTLEDTPVYHLTGRTVLPFQFGEPLGDMEADMQVEYWISVEDLRMVRSVVEGSVDFTGVDARATIAMTMDVFDYGAAIEIVAPEVETLPTSEPLGGALLPPQTDDDAQTHLELGLISFEDDRLGLAVAHFSRAIELQPDLTDAYLYRAIALVLMDDFSDNIDFNRVIMDRPDDAKAYFLRALHPSWGIEEGAGSDSCADAARASELRPEFAEAKAIQAACLCADPEGGTDRATRAFELFAEARTWDAAAVDALYAKLSGDCFSDLWRQEEVEQIQPVLPMLDADIASHPDLPSGYLARAQAILWLRDYTIEETIDAWIDIFHFMQRAGCPLGSQMRYGFVRSDQLAADREYTRYANCVTVDNIFDDIWDDEIDLSGVDALMARDPEFKAKIEELQRAVQEYRNQIVLPQQLYSVGEASLSSDGNGAFTFGDDNDVLQAWSLDGDPLGAFVFQEYISSAAFSPDVRLLATSEDVGKVSLWDLAAWSAGQGLQAVLEPEMPEGRRIRSLAFSADGAKLAAVDNSAHEVHIWSIETGEELARLQIDDDIFIESVALFTARPWIATAWDKQASILDSETGAELVAIGEPCEQEFGCLGSSIHFIAISPDETLVATAGRVNPDVKLWDAATGELVLTLPDHLEGGGPMAFSPDGRLLVTGGNDGVARLWDLDSGALLLLFGHRGSHPPTSFGWQIWSVAFSADGKRILTAGEDGTARLWDANTGEELATVFVTVPEMTE